MRGEPESGAAHRCQWSGPIFQPGRLTAAGFEGTVGSQGELAMRLASTPGTRGAGASPGIEITTRGRIDGNSTVSARQMGYLCSYDVIWRKQSK